MNVGRVFLENNSWMLETDRGFKVPVKNGQWGFVHPILSHGRHENHRVNYKLDKNGMAVVLEVIK